VSITACRASFPASLELDLDLLFFTLGGSRPGLKARSLPQVLWQKYKRL
jgi:hypothetical protein